ncbi:MAG: hypothetical protein AAFO96_00775 [Bacteroidota bacterium]
MKQLYVSILFAFSFLLTSLYAQNVLLEEDFTGLSGQGITGPAVANQIFSDPNGDWFIQIGAISGIADALDHARVEGPSISAYPSTTISESLQFQDVDEPVTFITRNILLSGVTTIDISLDVFEIGSLESSDIVQVGYILDGGTPVIVQTLTDDFSDSDGTGSSSTTDPGNTSPVTQTVTVSSLDVSANTRIEVFATADANSVSELIHFDNLSITTPDPLPVEWVSFEALSSLDQVALRWVTANEINNSHFEVERAGDTDVFEKIGTLVGKGDLAGQQDYTFVDLSPHEGKTLYRIKQVDIDGNFSFSQAIEVEVSFASTSFDLRLTGTDRVFELEFAKPTEGTVRVMDLQGRIHTIQQIDSQILPILDMQDLPAGVYWIDFRSQTGQQEGKRILLR